MPNVVTVVILIHAHSNTGHVSLWLVPGTLQDREDNEKYEEFFIDDYLKVRGIRIADYHQISEAEVDSTVEGIAAKFTDKDFVVNVETVCND